MTKLTCKIFIFLLVGSSTILSASEPIFKKEMTREVHETFDVSPGVKLGVQNKHGNIKISTWNRDQIQIDVLIKVKTSNSDKGQTFLDAIDIDFESSSSKVRAKTVLPDQENQSWWSSWFGNNKNLDYEVHYTIQAPQKMTTVLINKYGNITQSSIDGSSDITNKYGDIFLEDVTGDFSMTLGYGKAMVGDVGNANLEVKYSDVQLLTAENMEISSKYSDYKIKRCKRIVLYSKYDSYMIESVGSIKNDGKYDSFKIGTIDDFSIDTKYTSVSINQLNNSGKFDTKYGSVDVKSTGNYLEEINIHSKYTSYSFNIEGDFDLDFDGSKTDLHVSKPYEKYQYDKDGSDLKVKAYRGSKGRGAQIKAYMSYGGLDIGY